MDYEPSENRASDADAEMRDVFSEPEDAHLQEKRQPLADIKLEPAGSLPSFTETEEMEWEGQVDQNTSLHPVTVAPAGDPLADVINSINLSAMTISDNSDSSGETATPADCVIPKVSITEPIPEVEVDPPTPPKPVSPISSPTSDNTSNLMATPNTSMTLRRHRLATSSADPRRQSVDLQSSFKLQLGCPEMSFDLLNDKISFLNEGPSWGGGEDDTFDFKKEEAKMLAIAEEYERLITDETIPMPNPIRRSRSTQITLVE